MTYIIIGLLILGIGVYLLMFYRPRVGGTDIQSVDDIKRKADTNATRFTVRAETKVAKAQADFHTESNRAATEILRTQIIKEQRQHDLEDIELRRLLISDAKAQGLSVDAIVDLKKLEKQAEIALRKNFLYRLREYQQVHELSGLLESLMRRAYQIETSNDPPQLKQRLLAEVNENIAMHRLDLAGRRQKLLTAYKADDFEQVDADEY